MKELCNKLLCQLACVAIAVIIIIDVLAGGLDYNCKRTFSYNNIVLLLIALLISFAAGVLIIVIGNNIQKEQKRVPIILFVVLFLLSMYVGKNIFFSTGWDAEVLWNSALVLSKGGDAWVDYFSIYNNNLFFLFIEKQLAVIYTSFKMTTVSFDEWLLVVQAIVIAWTGAILYKVVIDYTNNLIYAYISWCIYIILIGISGWVCIPYTDIYGMFFPIAIIRIAQIIAKQKNQISNYIKLTLLSYFGFRIKPQIIIITIAFVIIWLLHSKVNKEMLMHVMVVLTALILCNILYFFSVKSLNMDLDKEKAFGGWHMVMMGLNEPTDGVYSDTDVAYSQSFSNTKQRNEGNRAEILNRINNYHLSGLIKHQIRKTLVVFNDGTFAWECEGSFYKVLYDDVNSLMSPLLKNVCYSSGKYFKYYADIRQIVWLQVLFLCAISYGRKDSLYATVVVALLGLIVFEEIFEARARYLICYVPVFIFVASIGMENLVSFFYEKRFNIKKLKI